ncbi:unnamed protein product [Notodromas monacha]|uniref:PEHE domain-containing protein n=1 Tax=Notodromas monacha TaxID=399045 RepID=A0A7R9BFR4_9CRUS|nr:unnamed protein product [Notodromas monacha]CAG0913949.1 unnamed protein product [Notodromas monacha]
MILTSAWAERYISPIINIHVPVERESREKNLLLPPMLEQQLERKNRRLSVKPKSPSGCSSEAVSAPSVSSTAKSISLDNRSAPRATPKRSCDRAPVLSQPTSSKLPAKVIVPCASRNANKERTIPTTSSVTTIAEEPFERQAHSLSKYAKVHSDFLMNWNLSPDDIHDSKLSPGKADMEAPIEWYIDKPPVRPDLARTRRSQGPCWRTDVTSMMAHEIAREEDLARLCQRGEAEEKRRIRWDLQSKRELGKRKDSEGPDQCEDESTASVNETSTPSHSHEREIETDAEDGLEAPKKKVNAESAKGDIDWAPIDNILFLFGSEFS